MSRRGRYRMGLNKEARAARKAGAERRRQERIGILWAQLQQLDIRIQRGLARADAREPLVTKLRNIGCRNDLELKDLRRALERARS